MSEPTPEMIAMARRIVADLYPHSPGERALILDGSWDRTPSVRAALAAIIETTRLATDLIGRFAKEASCGCYPCYGHDERDATYDECIDALSSFDHLKGQDHG